MVTNPKLNNNAPNILGYINKQTISPSPINNPAKNEYFIVFVFIILKINSFI